MRNIWRKDKEFPNTLCISIPKFRIFLRIINRKAPYILTDGGCKKLKL